MDGSYDVSVGYDNHKYINRLACKNAMISAAKSWIKNRYKGGELAVLVYSMRSAPMATACYIKKVIPKAKIYLIITDLPQFMDLSQNKVKAFLKRIDWKSIQHMKKKFDGFILYAREMARYLKLEDDQWILMEGSFAGEDLHEFPVLQAENIKAAMYSGMLEERYGVKLLVDTFMALPNDDIELWITGGGEAEDYIRACAEKDKRIKFYGFLSDRTDVLKLQKRAKVLINMRLPSEEASNYCFPSKLFEYMATGIPVLSFKIGGIPDEYTPYLILVDDVSGLSEALSKALESDPETCVQIGKKAREFILREKTPQKQCLKIWSFVKEVN